ncbi:hypothetical protein E2C01_012785 [Portunus trituberculatus]|uniref:Uncharacterized protein n=1 Tax=Portunus trituberculatus TaxID=210409 RepID=A0A5B7DFM1_PORTR|nr:hypothetical protein [Portunus trituberculatus]
MPRAFDRHELMAGEGNSTSTVASFGGRPLHALTVEGRRGWRLEGPRVSLLPISCCFVNQPRVGFQDGIQLNSATLVQMPWRRKGFWPILRLYSVCHLY